MSSVNPLDPATVAQMSGRLKRLYANGPYGAQGADECLTRILELVDKRQAQSQLPSGSDVGWDQRDVVLITYGDQIRTEGAPPLRTMYDFLKGHDLDKLIDTVHILPFCPYSSDDGFSVIDYRAVDPALGDWNDVRRLGERFHLMFDLVLNHVSSRSRWFEEYLGGKEPYTGYFIEVDPTTDLSSVTRPRSLPLLTQVETNRGSRHVWTTFSEDQVDLNFANPDVLVEMIDIFLFYIQQGARIIRLDAIAYLWKQLGTNCIHLQQTHEVVKLMRDLITAVAPQVILLTETNVPHAENISYFGSGDEAQMVYQFSLPPLLLDAFLSHDARPLVEWLSALQPAPVGTTFFNFTASHDGVGVRPLEGLISRERLSQLVDAIKARDGLISTRRQPDGTEAPYEMNVSYVSALGDPTDGPRLDFDLHARRFLTSQALMLSLRGIPAVYFHSLVGTTNDCEGVKLSGQPRRINRRKFRLDDLEQQLADVDSLQARIFDGYRRLLQVRIGQPAFHPDAEQDVWNCEEPWLVALVRTSIDKTQRILVLANVCGEQQEVDLKKYTPLSYSRDLLTDREHHGVLKLEPYELLWLVS
jgi:glycosidase